MTTKEQIEYDLKLHKIYLNNESSLIKKLEQKLKALEKTYHIGQCFVGENSTKGMLVHCGKQCVIYVDFTSGNLHEHSVKVSDIYHITDGELKRIDHTCDLNPIETPPALLV
jgi:hypothetical protein